MQLVVTFLRNLLAVPDPPPTAGSRGDHKTRARGELLARLLEEHALELLLIVAQHTDEACDQGSPGLAATWLSSEGNPFGSDPQCLNTHLKLRTDHDKNLITASNAQDCKREATHGCIAHGGCCPKHVKS